MRACSAAVPGVNGKMRKLVDEHLSEQHRRPVGGVSAQHDAHGRAIGAGQTPPKSRVEVEANTLVLRQAIAGVRPCRIDGEDRPPQGTAQVGWGVGTQFNSELQQARRGGSRPLGRAGARHETCLDRRPPFYLSKLHRRNSPNGRLGKGSPASLGAAERTRPHERACGPHGRVWLEPVPAARRFVTRFPARNAGRSSGPLVPRATRDVPRAPAEGRPGGGERAGENSYCAASHQQCGADAEATLIATAPTRGGRCPVRRASWTALGL